MARAHALLGWAMLNGRLDTEARDLLEVAVAEFADLEDAVVLADLKANLARAYNQFEHAGTEPKALTIIDEALAVAEHGNHPSLLAKSLLTKGGALGSVGRLREAIALFRASEEIAREHGLTDQVLVALTVRGYFLGEVDNVEAYKCFSDGLALARRVGHRALEQEFVNNFGYTSFLVGEWDRGLAEFDTVLLRELEPTQRIWNMSNMLIIRASRGDDIADELAELEQLATMVTDPHVLTAPNDTLANLAQAEGRFADAQQHWLKIADGWASQAPASYYQSARPALWGSDLDALRRHFTAIEATGVHGPVVEVRRTNMRAAIAALEGRSREALALYGEAFAGWGNLKVTWEQALTGLDMATVLDNSEPAVAAAIRFARDTFTRLGAKPYLDRLEMVIARGSAKSAKPNRATEATVAEPA
jgi:tetratricopeptide (TPR) repeat protein